MPRTMQTARRLAAAVGPASVEHGLSAHPGSHLNSSTSNVPHESSSSSTASGANIDAVGSPTSVRPAGLRDALAEALTAVDRLTALNADFALAILDVECALRQLPSSSATMSVPDDRRFELLSASTKGTARAVLHHGVRAPSDQMRRATRDLVEALKAAKGTVESADAPAAVVPTSVPPQHLPPPAVVAAATPTAPPPPAAAPPYVPPPPPTAPPAPSSLPPPPVEVPAPLPPQAPLASTGGPLPEQGIARWSREEIAWTSFHPNQTREACAQIATFAARRLGNARKIVRKNSAAWSKGELSLSWDLNQSRGTFAHRLGPDASTWSKQELRAHKRQVKASYKNAGYTITSVQLSSDHYDVLVSWTSPPTLLDSGDVRAIEQKLEDELGPLGIPDYPPAKSNADYRAEAASAGTGAPSSASSPPTFGSLATDFAVESGATTTGHVAAETAVTPVAERKRPSEELPSTSSAPKRARAEAQVAVEQEVQTLNLAPAPSVDSPVVHHPINPSAAPFASSSSPAAVPPAGIAGPSRFVAPPAAATLTASDVKPSPPSPSTIAALRRSNLPFHLASESSTLSATMDVDVKPKIRARSPSPPALDLAEQAAKGVASWDKADLPPDCNPPPKADQSGKQKARAAFAAARTRELASAGKVVSRLRWIAGGLALDWVREEAYF